MTGVWVYGPMSFRRSLEAERVGFSMYEFADTNVYDEQVWPPCGR